MTTGLRKPGEFCWTNMLTPQPDQARAFFAELLGWRYFEIPGLGHGVRVGGSDVGGIFDLEAPNTPPGTKPHIGGLLKVENADDICEKAASLGGKAKPAFDINDQGRMAVCTDPNGAEFDVWESKRFLGTDVDSTLHGAPSWFETLTTDIARATAFYSALFGWTPELNQMPGFEYTTFKLGTDPVAGMLQIRPEMGPLRPHWGTYYTVNDSDETARQAVSLGATLCVPVRDIPGVGRFCGITSPQGVMFYAIEYAR
jgi:predicted enzyme related to lactoylglutathione lyase